MTIATTKLTNGLIEFIKLFEIRECWTGLFFSSSSMRMIGPGPDAKFHHEVVDRDRERNRCLLKFLQLMKIQNRSFINVA